MSDVERARVQDRLRRAHDVGQLDLTEFDERLTSALAARTRGDLARAVADLPPTPPAPGRRPIFSDTGGGVTLRILTIIWASIAAANLAIWSVLALTVGTLYPWWLWVAVPPGVVLAVLYTAGIGRPPRP